MNRKLVFFFASALVVAGCAKEPQAETTPAAPDASEANFSLVASSDVFTKTELQEQTIVWKSGDKISVWEKGTANSNLPFELAAASAETPTGLFNGVLTPAAEFELLSIYPYSESYGDDPTALALTIPSTVNQTADINTLVGDSDFMIGHASSEEYDAENGGYKMLFQHPLAFVKFVIDGSNSVFREATIQSLTMTANKAFVGPVTVNLEDATITSAATDEDGKTLVINFPATAKMNTEQVAWVAINPVDLSDAGCKFVLDMTNGQKVTFTVNPNKMNSQALYEFQFKDIDAKIKAGKGVAKPVNLIDMNNNERANCYIIREGGYYLLPAQKVDKTKIYGDIEKPASAGYKADWLWATGTESKVYDVDFADNGGIRFWVKPNSNGNTIIALYNPEGKIVWSWHVWCSVEDPMAPTHYGRNNSWLMSARNLGALSDDEGNVESFGLMYQWGRKDPFPGPGILGENTANVKETSTFVTNTQKYIFNPTSTIKAFSSTRNSNTASVGDIAYSIANPTTNIHTYNSSGTTALSNTWLYTTPQAEALLLWNKDASRYGKTNYDPCPPGYIVPVSNGYAWYTLWNDNVSFESDTNLSGVVFKENDSNKSFYPAAGYRQSGQLMNVGYSCYYWAGNAVVDGSNLCAYGLQNLGRTKLNSGGKLYTQWALPVRCMKQ
jgi:hypothetical protein